jgi:hypothetical protein
MNTEEFLEHQKRIMIDAINETQNKPSTEDLRDYFAAAALTGMYAGYQGNAPEPEQVASDAYFIADEMLKEREK